MESIVKWRKGKPQSIGAYLILIDNKEVAYDYFNGYDWVHCSTCNVTRWCKIIDIEPPIKTNNRAK